MHQPRGDVIGVETNRIYVNNDTVDGGKVCEGVGELEKRRDHETTLGLSWYEHNETNGWTWQELPTSAIAAW
jgi:hypothetical protein